MKRRIYSLIAVILCFAMCFSVFGFADAAAPAAEPSESPDSSGSAAASKEGGPEEVIYARLDANGDPQDAYAVVALTLDEDGTVEHYGRYTAVENLTDTSPIEYAAGTVKLTAPAGRYYYQGTLRSAKMPWDIEITYKLNGREIDPDELGGKSGKLEVDIHTAVNSGFDPYFTENYMLQISVSLDADKCEDIASRNGTVASAGSSKQITFVVLPGSEGDVGFSAKVSDFAMSGFTIAAVPYSMDSVMDMGEVDGITNGIKQLTGAISQLTGGASAINEGAVALGDNSGTLTDASDQIADALHQIADGLQDYDLSEMTDGLDQLSQIPEAFSTVAAALSKIAEGVDGIAGGYEQITTQLQQKLGPMITQLGGLADLDKSTLELLMGLSADDMVLIQQLMENKTALITLMRTVPEGMTLGQYLASLIAGANPGGGQTGGGQTGGGQTGGGQTGGGGEDDKKEEDYIPPSGQTEQNKGNQDTQTTPTETVPADTEGLSVSLMSASSSSGGMADMPQYPGDDAPATEMFNYMIAVLNYLNSSLRAVADGMYEMSDEMMLAAIQFSDGLEGLEDMDLSAITEMQDGMVTLADSYDQFNEGLKAYTDGVGQLAEGMDAYTDGMYALNSETQGIPDMIDALLGTGDYEGEGESSGDSEAVVSFLDERNTDTASVQFVISTEGISAPEQTDEQPAAEEPKGFFAELWDKIVDLFT